MSSQAKQHAKDFLLKYKAKKETSNWLSFLIQKAIDTNGNISDKDKENIFTELLKENNLDSEGKTPTPKSNKDFTPKQEQTGVTSENQKLTIKKITHLKGVNALISNQSITFSPECTIIYGLNGTGKSGYFRIIHELAGGDKAKDILGNIHSQGDGLEVDVDFLLNNDSQRPYKWQDKSERGIVPFDQIKVFDSEYLPIFLNERESSINIEPFGLNLFQVIASIIDAFKDKLDQAKKQKSSQQPEIQTLIDIIHSCELKLLLQKSSLTEAENNELNDNKTFSYEETEKLAQLKQEKDSLEKNNTEDSKKVLIQEKKEIDELKNHLSNLKTNLETLTKDISIAINNYLEKKKTREDRVKQLKVLKSIPSQDTEEWQTFIESAEDYGTKIEQSVFNKDEKCIYCHQPLGEAGIKLVQAYSEYLSDQSQQKFKSAADKIGESKTNIDNIATEYSFSENLKKSLTDIKDKQNQTYKILADQTLEEAKKQKTSLAKALREKVLISSEYTLDLSKADEKLVELSKKKQKTLVGLQQSETQKKKKIGELEAEINSLKDKQNITKYKTIIKDYFSCCQFVEKYATANQAISTRGITELGAKAHDELLTDSLRKSFEDELKLLVKDTGVSLEKTGADKGSVRTSLKIAGNDVSDILSEGEQKAVGLALFLAEIENQNNNCPIVFDDPVNSLDHKIRGNLAKRVAKLSKNQQVIIFTHDLLFVSQLVKFGGDNGINLITHVIDRPSFGIGRVNENSSPKMATLVNLKAKYTDSVQNFDSLDFETQERSLANAFDYLRCSCECIIEEVLFAGTIQRYDDHVKVQNLEEAVFDRDLAVEIVKVHGEISEKAMMHNKSDFKGQEAMTLEAFTQLKTKFETLESNLRRKLKENRNKREKVKKQKKSGLDHQW